MGKFVKGEVIVIPFPFCDIKEYKRRPALVLAPLDGNEVILCAIMSRTYDSYSIRLEQGDFVSGSLDRNSNIRPNRIFTADEAFVIRSVGKISNSKIDEVIGRVTDFFR